MKKTLIFTLAILVYTQAIASPSQSNPFTKPSPLPLHAPQFDRINDNDYVIAFEEGMKQQLAEINAIANSKDTPTFDNTISAIEKSGLMLDRVSDTFFAVAQANTNDKLKKIQSEMAPKLSAHSDAIVLNPKLFDRVKTLYDQRSKLHLSPEATLVLKDYYQQFIHAGANLNAAAKNKLREFNKQLAILETEFQQKLIAANKAGELKILDRNNLSGLSDNETTALAVMNDGQEKYVIPLQNTTQQPLLSSLTKRKVRQQLFENSWQRTEKNDRNDTRNIVLKIAKIRAQKAALLGLPNYADYKLYNQMAVTSKAVHAFLDQLIQATTAKINLEAKDIQSRAAKQNESELKPWDWNFYAEQIRKIQYNLNENQLKPYLELNNVLEKGVFYSANLLYGTRFKERFDLPVYQPDVRVFDVIDHDGSLLGLLYLDFYKRDNKSGGAWTSDFVPQSKLLGTKPVVYVVTNFTKPAAGQAALLTFEDVITIFHEFGHALNGLFSNVTYPSSNNIARDFVEFPSQFNEHLALYPKVIKNYAEHYQTHQPIQPEVINKIKQAMKFNQGYKLGELLAAANLDMQWHEITPATNIKDVDSFETQALKNTHTNFANVPPRYRSSYFLHIWANGYQAGYYAYLWSEMLDDAAFSWFMQHGGVTRENGQRFRDMILSRGHTMDYNKMFQAFYGKKPDIKALLEYRGLNTKTN